MTGLGAFRLSERLRSPPSVLRFHAAARRARVPIVVSGIPFAILVTYLDSRATKPDLYALRHGEISQALLANEALVSALSGLAPSTRAHVASALRFPLEPVNEDIKATVKHFQELARPVLKYYQDADSDPDTWMMAGDRLAVFCTFFVGLILMWSAGLLFLVRRDSPDLDPALREIAYPLIAGVGVFVLWPPLLYYNTYEIRLVDAVHHNADVGV